MNLNNVQPKPAFSDYGLKAARQFLKTVVVIDDEIVAEPPTPKIEGDVIAPPFTDLAVNVEPVIVENAAIKDAEIQIKPLADAFLDKKIVCGLLKPEASDDDINVIDRAVRAATVADIVIIDWYLRTGQDGLARSILEKILKEDSALNGRLRLIIVYTSADPLAERKNALAKHFKKAHFDVVEYPDDDTLLVVGCCRIRFVRKKSANDGVAVNDLPDLAVKEFSKHSSGLLANFSLMGIAALRDATHHILANLSSGLDAAFVGHRMLQGHSTDANLFAMNLFLLQMKGILSLPKHLGGALNDDELSAWLDERLNYEGVEVHLESIGISKDQLFSGVIKGEGRLDLAHKALFIPESLSDIAKVGEFEKKISQNFARFCTFVREPDGFNSLPEGWRPTLTLGSVVKLVARKTRYFLCVQPACDTVRIDEERYFPFVELVTTKSPAKSTENLVIRDANKQIVVCVSMAAGSRFYDRFKPDESQVVRGEIEDGKFVFSSPSEKHYWWLGDIDPLKAQRIATDISGTLARVGIDEYEWLRRGGSAKK